MHTLCEHLLSLPFFQSLDRETVDEIAACGEWYSLAGGWPLFHEGAAPERLSFVISGRLIVVRHGTGSDEVVGYVRAGEPVGEMSLLSGEAHSASVYALRDTEMISVPRENFEAMIEERGDLATALAKVTLRRARHPKSSFAEAAPRVFALVAGSRSVDVEQYARDLARRAQCYGVKAIALPIGEEAPDSWTFDETEVAHDVLILPTRIEDSGWYKFVLRHADRFFVMTRRDARPSRPFPLSTERGTAARRFRLVDLVMIEEGIQSCPTIEWADAIGANRIFHLRGEADAERLARVIAGKSIGLVLSGGGARAYAHIGAIKAMRERGLPIDFVAGASMGGLVAASVAMGWDDEEIEWRIKDAFVSSNPLGDFVLPVVALAKGKRVEERLKTHFDDTLIEELAIPYFCVSSELTKGEVRIHRRGCLREALRASISLPGILPPVVDGEDLLVDGAVINNFPIDIMASFHRGLTIGIDAARRGLISVEPFEDPPGFLNWVREHGLSEAPPIISLLMRSATARREPAIKVNPADIMIAPTVAGIQLRDWEKYDEAVSEGYNATSAEIEKHWDVFEPIVKACEE